MYFGSQMADSKRVPKIIVLGAGVIGLSTAFYCQLRGVETIVYAAATPAGNTLGPIQPSIASFFPAASIIPHSVSSPHVDRMTEYSHTFYEFLANHNWGGVRKQKHFEAFEFQPNALPGYANTMSGFKELPKSGKGTPDAPRREGVTGIYGWYFNTCFAEMRTYLAWLSEHYLASGGKIIVKDLTAQQFLDIPCDVRVNCAGLHSDMFGDDPEKPRVIRGHLVAIDVPNIPSSPVSWNYHPLKEIYQNAQGEPADIYNYPRSIKGGGWVVGGSRQYGQEIAGKWEGEETVGRTVKIQGIDANQFVDVPAPVWELNRELILKQAGIDIENYSRRAFIGYRPVRTGPSSLRLEKSPIHENLIHNYGHGGSGVTLAMGCAVEVASIAGLSFQKESECFQNPKYADVLNCLQQVVMSYPSLISDLES